MPKTVHILHKPLELNMHYFPEGTEMTVVKGLKEKYHVFYNKKHIGSISGKQYHQYFVR